MRNVSPSITLRLKTIIKARIKSRIKIMFKRSLCPYPWTFKDPGTACESERL